MENTSGQKSHSINYGPGQQRYFSLGISHSQSPGYTMCQKQKNQTKRKGGGYFSWLRKGFFFPELGKLEMQGKDQQQSWLSECSDMAMKVRSWRASPFHICFRRDNPTITLLTLACLNHTSTDADVTSLLWRSSSGLIALLCYTLTMSTSHSRQQIPPS